MTIDKRYDFVLYFDVQDGNPNGDPDAGNLPRVDPETGQGLVSDVCLKRKIRNYIATAKNGTPGFDLFIREKAILNSLIADGHAKAGNVDVAQGKGKEAKATAPQVDAARKKMCETYFDVRTFGAVMTTGANAGQVRGPVQITFGRSVDPIVTLEHSITRMAVTTEKESESQNGDNRTMGRKNTVPYALYRAHGFVTPSFAKQTGFSATDLQLLWDALRNMFEIDRSAARGLMSTRALIIFEHASPLGSAPAQKLFERATATRRTDVPRSFSDYSLMIDGQPLPELQTWVRVADAAENAG